MGNTAADVTANTRDMELSDSFTSMDEPSLALLDASVGTTPAAENFRRVLSTPVSTYKVSNGELPPQPSDRAWTHDGVVISGSQVSVYEDRPWIRAVQEWVSECVETNVPVLGVCWGHQLLATALGGRVEPLGEYELGYATIETRVENSLFEGIDEQFVAFESHSDTVTELPPGATVLTDNEIGVQSFAATTAYGVQFHPEYDVETARWVVQNKEDELEAERFEDLLSSITPDTHERTAEARAVFGNFEAIVERSRS